MQQNRLYGYPVPAAQCPARPANGFSSGDAFRSYATAYLSCQHQGWLPVFRGMGVSLPMPKIVWFGPSAVVNTPCGTVRNMEVSMYCGNNSTGVYTIYVNSELIEETNTWWTLRAAETLSHEYFHHVQMRAGILDAGNQLSQSMPSNEIARRKELQAACGSMALIYRAPANKFTRNDYDIVMRWSKHDQDERHGNAASNELWVLRGLYSDRVQGCTTWLVGSESVA